MKSSLRRLACALLLASLCSILTTTAFAQYRASINGVVTDPQGAVVPGASVTLTDKETSRATTTTTNGNGFYTFQALRPSKYSVAVEKSGFKKKVFDDVAIIPEQANALNAVLDLGAASETVTVSGDKLPLIDTETSQGGGTIRSSDIQKLPSFGRDPFQLLQLAPGAFGDGATQSAQIGGGSNNLPGTTIGGTGATDGIFKIENGGQITANGARTGENNYQIDGVGTTSVTWGGTSVITPNEDSIKEVKVVTDNYDAENGRYRGAQVQIISQNGTNQYHGSIYLKAHRPGLNAFQKYGGYNFAASRDDNRFNDYGGTVGGPIWKNKLFAFFSIDKLNNKQRSQSGSGWYETPEFRALAAAQPNAAAFFNFPGAGPFGGVQADVVAGETKDCADFGLAEGVNCITIPGKGLNLGTPLVAARGTRDTGYVSPFVPGTGGDGLGGANNLDPNTATIAFYTGIKVPSDSTHTQYNGRIDFNPTSKDLIAFSMYYVPNTSFGLNGNGLRQANSFSSDYRNRAMTVLWDRTISSTMVNEVRVNAAGWQNKDLADNPGAPWGLPQISYSLANNAVNGFGIGSFNGFDQWTYAAKDVLTKVHGAHTMKMGGEYTRLLSVDAPFWSDRPGYTFNNMWDFLNDAPVTENAQFDPKTGVPSALRKDLRSSLIGLFFQDNYKARPNLTLTAGLRWEYFGPISEKNGQLATVVLGQGSGLFSNLRVRTGGTQTNAQKSNFGPQLGFNWSPKAFMGHEFESKLVLRGGIGMSFNGLVQSNTLDVRFNPPFTYNSQTLACPATPGGAGSCTYLDTFPTNVNSPVGYAANPNSIVTFGPDNLPLTGRVDLTALPATEPTTYSYHYTLTGEYDLGHQWVMSLGYQGSTTRHLTQHYNLYNPGSARNYALNPKVGGITYYGNDGSARFNALLLELRHSFGQSFQLNTQYRLSHSMDSGSNAYAGGFYQWNMATNFATSDYDTRHAFKIFGIWSPRIFKSSSNAWLEKIAGGWSISGILNAHSGFPWTPQYGIGTLTGGFDPVYNFGQNSGGSSGNAGQGTLLPGAYLGGFHPNFRSGAAVDATPFFQQPVVPQGALFECLFPTAVGDPNCPTGQVPFGGLPSAPGIARNSFTGPGYFDVDMTLSKSFGLPTLPILGENAKIEFRANFYNIFNKLNMKGGCDGWTGVQCDINSSHFGESGSALGARVVEMQARFSF